MHERYKYNRIRHYSTSTTSSTKFSEMEYNPTTTPAKNSSSFGGIPSGEDMPSPPEEELVQAVGQVGAEIHNSVLEEPNQYLLTNSPYSLGSAVNSVQLTSSVTISIAEGTLNVVHISSLSSNIQLTVSDPDYVADPGTPLVNDTILNMQTQDAPDAVQISGSSPQSTQRTVSDPSRAADAYTHVVRYLGLIITISGFLVTQTYLLFFSLSTSTPSWYIAIFAVISWLVMTLCVWMMALTIENARRQLGRRVRFYQLAHFQALVSGLSLSPLVVTNVILAL